MTTRVQFGFAFEIDRDESDAEIVSARVDDAREAANWEPFQSLGAIGRLFLQNAHDQDVEISSLMGSWDAEQLYTGGY